MCLGIYISIKIRLKINRERSDRRKLGKNSVLGIKNHTSAAVRGGARRVRPPGSASGQDDVGGSCRNLLDDDRNLLKSDSRSTMSWHTPHTFNKYVTPTAKEKEKQEKERRRREKAKKEKKKRRARQFSSSSSSDSD